MGTQQLAMRAWASLTKPVGAGRFMKSASHLSSVMCTAPLHPTFIAIFAAGWSLVNDNERRGGIWLIKLLKPSWPSQLVR
jgi:hypothetical protein